MEKEVQFSTSPSSRNYTNFSKQRRFSNEEGQSNGKSHTKQIFIIGITGGTASGKTTVTDTIVKRLADKRVAVIAQDSFYKSLTIEQRESAKKSEYNFDHPEAFDYDLMYKTLKDLKTGKTIQVPIYDFISHTRSTQTVEIESADIIIIEGILVLYMKEMREIMDMKIFVDTDPDLRLIRRIKRDIADRGRELNGVLLQYEKFVKPSFDDFILPTKKHADIIIPRGGDNFVAIDLLVKHIKLKLDGDMKQTEQKQTKQQSEHELFFN